MMHEKWFRIWFCALVICLMLSAGQAQQWSEEISVDPAGTISDTPDMDIDLKTGHLHIVSMVRPQGVMYTELDKKGKIIRQMPVDLAASDDSEEGIRFGATVAVDTNGVPHICYRNYLGNNLWDGFYTYWTGNSWSQPLQLYSKVARGWAIRIDVDNSGKAHIIRGSMAGKPGEELTGPVKYYQIYNNSIVKTIDDIYRYRADDRLEIDASYKNQIHMILGCPDYPVIGGPVWYWRSFDGGSSWSKSEIHNINARDANGAPDLFVDGTGTVHIVYGSEHDWELDKTRSVRYVQIKNDQTVIDKPVTIKDEILYRYDTPQGVGSIASSADGQIVMVFYSENFDKRLFIRESKDGGQTFSDRTLITESSCTALGRNRQIIRAFSDKFFALYPTPSGLKLKYKHFSVNQLPVANAGGPYTVDEGATVTFNGSNSSDPDGNIVSYEWDFEGDGVYDVKSANPTHSQQYADNYSGQVKLRVTDNEGDTHTAQVNIMIKNVAPKAEAGGPYSVDLGGTVNFHGTGTDPGADQLDYAWDLDNNGSFEFNGQDAQKVYNQGGRFLARLRVKDDDGGVGIDTARINVQTNPPTISTIPNQTINEGNEFTPINLNQYVSDSDNPDNDLIWTFLHQNHLKVTQQSQMAYIAPADSEWSGSETIGFVVTDPTQLSDTANVTFTIQAVNDPPVVKPINVPAINEGDSFNPIALDDYVSDVDNPKSEIKWSHSGAVQLQVEIDAQNNALVSIPDLDWFGTEKITFTATDRNGNGKSGKTVVTFKVNPVNDPPVITGNPGQTIMSDEVFKPVLLDTIVNDIDNTDQQITWTFSGNQQLRVTIVNRILNVTKPSDSWNGTETIKFIASDGQATAEIMSNLTVIYDNKPPEINGIGNVTIDENEKFPVIDLNACVEDKNHPDNQLTWTITGNLQLKLSGIEQRLLTISVPDSEWSGSEVLLFEVKDPDGLSDNVRATFTVNPVNDPPRIIIITDFLFDEDSQTRIPAANLKQMVKDADNPFSELKFSLENNTFTRLKMESNGDLVIYADKDWAGVEYVNFKVTDKNNAFDSKLITITVNQKPDPPKAFSLLEPSSGAYYELTPTIFSFKWEKANDPDPDDAVKYSWQLSREAGMVSLFANKENLSDSSYDFNVPQNMEKGTYYWQVVAKDKTGNLVRSKSKGIFILKCSAAVNANNEGNAPQEFTLLPNHPNPFNAETRITYHLPKNCNVRLRIFNNLGQLVKDLVDEQQPAGVYSLIWNGKDTTNNQVTSGIYILKLESADFNATQKLLLVE
ncbi:T9SS type A sorting domain-containing protein [candidate division KSB1 bacterium]|nr:T9SS type A sorting domain-containing protein [candidate division KSB1 bacterium]